MHSNLVATKHKTAIQAYGNVSTRTLEQIIKELGFITSRKNLSRLTKLEMISQPEILNDSTSNGKRVHFPITSLIELISYLLAVSVSGLKGRTSENRVEYFLYAKEALAEIGDKADINVVTQFNSLLSANYFVEDCSLNGSQRLEAVKQIQLILKRVLLALWFSNRLVHAVNADIVSDWQKVRDNLFSCHSLKRFSTKLQAEIDSDNATSHELCKAIENIKDAVKDNSEARIALITWLEICIAFSTGLPFILAEIECYMLKHFNVTVKLNEESWLSVATLYKLLKNEK